jgi:hypothetical protein
LGIEEAGLGLDHADGAIVGIDGEELSFAVGNDGSDGESQVLRVHFSGEAVANTLLLASGDLNAISSGSQVTNNLALFIESRQRSSDEVDGHRSSFFIGKSDQCLGRVTIDKLNAEDLGSWEGSLRRYSELLNLGDVLRILGSVLMVADLCEQSN